MTLVITPRVTDKSYAAAGVENGVYTFVVPKLSNKHEVKEAVEKLYDVTVTNVNISILKGKTKRFAQKRGRSSTGTRQSVKKAYVTLKSGDNIPVFNPEAVEEAPSKIKGKK
jgi:large subunit ribosomal protein L23